MPYLLQSLAALQHNNSYYLLSLFYLSGTILGALNVLTDLILTTLWKVLLIVSFSDEETEIKKLALGYTDVGVAEAAPLTI